MLLNSGFRVRHVLLRVAEDGSIQVSPPLLLSYLQENAVHGDYVWLKKEHDSLGD